MLAALTGQWSGRLGRSSHTRSLQLSMHPNPRGKRSVITALIPPGCPAIEPYLQIRGKDDWRAPLLLPAPLAQRGTPERAVVALGKFDAMHLGHRLLAEEAAKLGGYPWLLSFSGMDRILGWAPRKPLVAPLDRPRVLRGWSPTCGNLAPIQRYIPFEEIREMSPEAFVEVLAAQLGAGGVVAGSNYRFGYRAKGDARALEELGAKYGMRVRIVNLVAVESDSSDTTSSSSIRARLAEGDVDSVAGMLGRRHRVVAEAEVGPPASKGSSSTGNGNKKAAAAAALEANAVKGGSGSAPDSAPRSASGSGAGGSGAGQVVLERPPSAVSGGASGSPSQCASSGVFIPEERAANQVPGPGVYTAGITAIPDSIASLMVTTFQAPGIEGQGPFLSVHPGPDSPDVSWIRFDGVEVEVGPTGDMLLPEEVAETIRGHQTGGGTWTFCIDF